MAIRGLRVAGGLAARRIEARSDDEMIRVLERVLAAIFGRIRRLLSSNSYSRPSEAAIQRQRHNKSLDIAAQNGHVAITEQLIKARCNVDLQQKVGAIPLFIAVKTRCINRNLGHQLRIYTTPRS